MLYFYKLVKSVMLSKQSVKRIPLPEKEKLYNVEIWIDSPTEKKLILQKFMSGNAQPVTNFHENFITFLLLNIIIYVAPLICFESIIIVLRMFEVLQYSSMPHGLVVT